MKRDLKQTSPLVVYSAYITTLYFLAVSLTEQVYIRGIDASGWKGEQVLGIFNYDKPH